MVNVDDQALKHALHLACNLVEQRLELAGFNEGGNVVIGEIALARLHDPGADARRHGFSVSVLR
jgi:hypothetical protein